MPDVSTSGLAMEDDGLKTGSSVASVGVDTGPKLGMVEKPTMPDCINLVPTPVQIGPAEIELELYKCYDEGKPGFLRRASFSLWMTGVITLLTTGLSFLGFLHTKDSGASWKSFFAWPVLVQICTSVLFVIIGGMGEQFNSRHKKDYIDGVMKRYKQE